jgi:phosphoserine phosphatase RsbU/P
MLNKDKLVSMLDDNLFNALGEAFLLIDKEYNVIYSNASFKAALLKDSSGNKCYQLIGKDSPCQICTCSQSSKKQFIQEKEEKINENYYLVSSQIIPKKPPFNSFYIETYKDITYSRNLEQSLLDKNAILKKDLDIAKQVQQSLLPKQVASDRIKLTYRYLPCDELGGDFFNLYQIDEDNYGIFIADISGHGASAAMLTMFLNSSYNKMLRSPAEILGKLFFSFNENSFIKNQYIAIFYGVVNTKERKFTYCNAGLNSIPVIYNGAAGTYRLIEAAGFPISNWVDAPDYTDAEIDIKQGDKILFCTDGITEAKNKQGVPFGTDRLIRSLIEGNHNTKITLDRILSYLEDFIDGSITELKDDVSLVILDIG